MNSTQFRALMKERRKAQSPRDRQPYFGSRKAQRDCIRKYPNSPVYVMADGSDGDEVKP